jgi:hypothetical protein
MWQCCFATTAMIRQFKPTMSFVIFNMGVNNWLVYMMTLRNLDIQHFDENITPNDDNSLNIKDLIKNYFTTYV